MQRPFNSRGFACIVINVCYYLDITILKKLKIKRNVVVMEPVIFHQESVVHVLRECLADRINITDIVSSLSDIIRVIALKGPADIYIMEAYGQNENYNNWGDFTHFMAANYPFTNVLIWSSKPTMFLRKFNAFEGGGPCWQIPKRIGIDCFVRFLTRILDGETFTAPRTHSYIGPPISNLTLSEIIIITSIIDGNSINSLAKKNDVAYKTVSAHKRNAMIKMCISSNAQLHSLLKDKYIVRGNKEWCESSDNQPFLL